MPTLVLFFTLVFIGCPLSALAIPSGATQLTAGAFTSSWGVSDAGGDVLFIDGPDGREEFHFFFQSNTVHDQALNEYGQYVGAIEAHNDGAALFAIYGFGGAVPTESFYSGASPWSGEQATGTFGILGWEIPELTDPINQVRGPITIFLFDGAPSAVGRVDATVVTWLIDGPNEIRENHPVHWFLPPSPYSPLAHTPEPASGLLVLGGLIVLGGRWLTHRRQENTP